MKQKSYAILILSCCLLLSGCKSTDYNKAIEACKQEEYDEAISLFITLGDYEDSQNQASHAAEEYVDSLIKQSKYDTALEVMDKYNDLCDFSSLRVEVENEKQIYDAYKEAIEIFESGKNYKAGIEILQTLPEEYKNTKELLDSYDTISKSRFLGKRTYSWVDDSGDTSNFVLVMTLQYENKFVLSIYKKTESDGYTIMEDRYTASAAEVETGEITKSNHTWYFDGGVLTERNLSEVYTYH